MSETGKILDVTYGTFSCRLEGFDDSVETMKTVVTFFHELAGHDRFMDMAPQAPDLETLAELTSKHADMPVEVEAETDTQRVSLRVQRPDPAAEPAEQERPSLRIPRPAAVVPASTFLAQTEDEDLSAMADDDTDADISDLDTLEDDDADFAAPIDEPQANILSDEESTDDDDFDAEWAEEGSDDDDDIVAETTEEEVPAAAQMIPAVSPDVDSNESVAAKLQRIRAIVGRGAAAPSDDTFAEDLPDSAAPAQAAVSAPAANPLAQRLAELARRNSELAAEDEADDEVETEDMAAEPIDDDTPAAPFMAEDEGDEEDDGDEDTLTEEEHAEFAAEEDDDQDDDQDEMVDNFLIREMSDAEEALQDTDDDLDEEEPALMDDMSEDELAAQSNEDDTDEDSESISDEDDLHKQVAEVEQAIAMRRENRSKRDELPRNVDAAMSRILSQADARLNEPEGRRHRDAFAQLKAAVAATEAARQLGDSGAGARDPGEIFREDLDAHEAEEAQEAAKEADEEAIHPAPLRLVPAQRVTESEQPSDRATDRLRRIASEKEANSEKTGGFAEFAAQQGATELADLLEAAAAYIAFVEGDDDFSRPQVMKKVQMASADEFSREDGLRSFGRLLRQSRIIKLNNGRFQVSENTRFRPDDKAAQG